MDIYIVKMLFTLQFGTVVDSEIVGVFTDYEKAKKLKSDLSRRQNGSAFITIIDESAVEMIKDIMERKEE